jgi:hypothetical protein
VLAAAGMWGYAQFILIPHQQADSAERNIPRGNLSDLYPRWLGARELLLHGRDPYSHDITQEIQAGYYGRSLDPSRSNDPKDQQAFAYPVYVVFLLAPTVHLPFSVVRAGFSWILTLVTAASVPLWFRVMGQRVPRGTQLTWIILLLGSFPFLQGLKLQQLTLLVCALLAVSALAWTRGWLILAGILLSVATIKPQLAAIPAAWLVVWTLGNWRERQRLFWSLALTTLALVMAGELILPGWIHDFRTAAADYWQYTGGGNSVLDTALAPLFGKLAPSFGKLADLAILTPLAIRAWRLRCEPAASLSFAWMLAVLLAATLVVIPTFAIYNQVLILPALMFIVAGLKDWRQLGPIRRFLIALAAVALLLPWVAAVSLDLALTVMPRPSVLGLWKLPLATALAVPLTVLAVIALCAPAGHQRPKPTAS